MVSNYTFSAIALKIEPCLVIMEEISWKQDVFTLKAKSANNGIELFHPLALPPTPESDMLADCTPPAPQSGNPRDCRGPSCNSLQTRNRETKH